MLAQLLIAGNFFGALGNELWIERTKTHRRLNRRASWNEFNCA